MANSDDVKRALAGDKNLTGADLKGTKSLKGADLEGADLTGADLRHSSLQAARFRGAKLKRAQLRGSILSDAKLTNADLEGADLTHAFLRRADLTGATFHLAKLEGADFKRADLIGAKLKGADFTNADLSGADFTNADLSGAKGIPLSISDKFPHKGETVEEARRKEIEKIRMELEEIEKKIKKSKSIRNIEKLGRDLLEPLFQENKNNPELLSDFERVRDQFVLRIEWVWEYRERREAIQDITKRVSRAKEDKELEDLAIEVGSLQAQPEYVEEYDKVLNGLQAKIEKKYSLLSKANRFIKKLISRGRRASQMRTASQMLNQLNREISDLKKEL
jgi:uncharacterized protein YjbI with pentapeptide repeats